MYTKLVPETVNYISFTSKFIWNYLCLFIYLFGIIYKNIFWKFNNTMMNNWFISKTVNIRGDFI